MVAMMMMENKMTYVCGIANSSAFALGLALCLRSPTISRTASTGGTVLRHARTVRPHRDRSGPYGTIVDVSILMAAATVVVTKPFSFEGRKRAEHAELGVKFLKKFVDSIVVVPNDKLLEVADSNTSFVEAFNMADEVLKKGVQGITDLIAQDGMINLDFADVETVMRDRGVAHMGIGSGKGEDKVKDAVKNAIESPLPQ